MVVTANSQSIPALGLSPHSSDFFHTTCIRAKDEEIDWSNSGKGPAADVALLAAEVKAGRAVAALTSMTANSTGTNWRPPTYSYMLTVGEEKIDLRVSRVLNHLSQYALTMHRYAPNYQTVCPQYQAPENIEKCHTQGIRGLVCPVCR